MSLFFCGLAVILCIVLSLAKIAVLCAILRDFREQVREQVREVLVIFNYYLNTWILPPTGPPAPLN